MNKKAMMLAGALALTGAAAVGGYMSVMTRENKLSRLINERNSNGDTTFDDFNKSKHDWINAQDTERVYIINDKGHKLAGFLTMSKGSNVFVFFAHGHHTDHMGDPANFMRYYVEKGYNFLTVDHRGQGESEGRYIGFDLFESMDSLKWLDWLIERFGEDIKIILHGVSMGASTVCKMADRVPPQVKLIIADCPFTSAIEEFDCVVKNAGIKKTKTLLNAFNAMNIAFAGYDLRDTNVRLSVENSKVPMLFVHGDKDALVPLDMSVELYDICKNEKELYIVANAEHAQSICEDENGYHKKLDEFIEKYL